MVRRVLLISLFVFGIILGAWGQPQNAFAAPAAEAQTAPAFKSPNESLLALASPFALEKTATLAELGYLKDETLQGVSASRTYTLSWPDAWEVQPGNMFTVEFTHSPSLETYSSLAIDFNGTRLGSVLLTPDNADGGNLSVKIPEDQIETGYNSVRVVLYMGIHDDRCEDPNNPATWATIKSSSFFNLGYAEKEATADLGAYPAPLIDNSNLLDNDVTFVLPEKPTAAELNGMTLISAKLGQLAAWRTVNFHSVAEPQASGDALVGDVIYVGQAGRLQKLAAGDLPFTATVNGKVALKTADGTVVDPKAGVVYMQPSAANPTTVELFVTGADDAAVLNAARGLATDSAFSRFQGQQAVVLGVPEPEKAPEGFRQRMTFAELGYEDMTASGTRRQTLNYVIPLPMQWQVLTEAKLNLHFAHSRLLHEQQSSLTVGVNGSPIGSILLDGKNADDGNSEFTIPARMLKIGDNKLTITTDIELIDGYENAQACDDEHITEAWVVAYSDSNFTLPGGPASMTLSLADYPFAFIGRADLADLVFVVPDEPSSDIISGMAMIAGQIGKSAEGDALMPHVVFASDSQAAAQYPNQILMGRPSENPAITSLNDELPLPFQPGSDNPMSLPKVAQVASPTGSTGYVQAVLTKDGMPRLVVTGNGSEGLAWAALAVSQPALMRDLAGDLAIMDSANTITTAYVNEPVAPVEVAPVATEGAASTTRWVVWLAAGLFLVAILVLLMIAGSDFMNRRKARKSYESPTL